MPAVPLPRSLRWMTWILPGFSEASRSAISPVPSGELSSTMTMPTPSCFKILPTIFSMLSLSL